MGLSVEGESLAVCFLGFFLGLLGWIFFGGDFLVKDR